MLCLPNFVFDQEKKVQLWLLSSAVVFCVNGVCYNTSEFTVIKGACLICTYSVNSLSQYDFRLIPAASRKAFCYF